MKVLRALWVPPNRDRIPARIALLYATFGGMWMAANWLLAALLPDTAVAGMLRVEAARDLLYIAVGTGLVYGLVRGALQARGTYEQARDRSESRYRQIFEHTSSVACLVDTTTRRVVDVNPAACAFYGWPREHLLGRLLSDISTIPPEELEQRIDAAAQERRNYFVSRHRLASGEIRDVEVHTSPLEINGRCYLFSIIHDITERQRAEAALAASEAKYRLVLEQASDAILITDLHGRMLEVNSRAVELLGYARQELVGREVYDLMPVQDLERQPPRIDQLKAGHIHVTERRLRRKDGTLVHVEISTKLLEDGRIQGIARDITVRRMLEEQLRQAQKMEAVGQLTGGIAHDLNNLLTVVLANSELIALGLPEEAQGLRADLEELQGAARRGAAMIGKLLSFSRHAPLTFATLDIAEVAADLLDTLRRLLPAHIHIELFHDGSNARIKADAGALEQILLNLGTNARDAMPAGGHLRIETRVSELAQPPGKHPPGQYVCLSVSDEGTGMDDYTQARVFEPFFTTKPPGQGSGLGMAMIYGLAEQHGGFVTLESAVGVGTTVRVYFPLAAEPVEVEPRVDPSLAGLRGGQECLLLVEDEDALRRVAMRALQNLGYTVLSASDGEEALELFSQHEPRIQLIITDVIMPRLGGLGLCQVLRRQGKAVRFLFTSGYAAHEILKTDLPDGEVMLLQKPWSLAEFTDKVRQVLDAGGPPERTLQH